MLSIGKLVAGQAKYYLDQAEARVDTLQSVADGLEDYYIAGTEARGDWLGRARVSWGSRVRSPATTFERCSPAAG